MTTIPPFNYTNTHTLTFSLWPSSSACQCLACVVWLCILNHAIFKLYLSLISPHRHIIISNNLLSPSHPPHPFLFAGVGFFAPFPLLSQQRTLREGECTGAKATDTQQRRTLQKTCVTVIAIANDLFVVTLISSTFLKNLKLHGI